VGVANLNSPHEQVRDVISQQLGCNILNCVSDVNFSVASFIYNKLVEEIMMALDSTLNGLVSVLLSTNCYLFIYNTFGYILYNSLGLKGIITELD